MSFFSNRDALKRDMLDLQTSASERSKWTPDCAQLEEHAFQLLFVYDRLQPDFPDYEKVVKEHVIHAGVAFTNEKFVMQKFRLGKDSYPIIQRKENYIITPPRRIKGQLYYIQSEVIKELDSMARNGIEFKRELLEIYMPYTQLKKPAPMLYGKEREEAVAKGEPEGRTRAEYLAVFGTEHPSFHIKRDTILKAYAYVGINDYWDGLSNPEEFEGISPIGWGNVQAFKAHDPKIGTYYHFTKRELIDK